MLRSFADIPQEIRRRVEAGERVVLILLDAFGLEFLGRHGGHPLLGRLDVTELRSQFPPTTTAHVTTMHFGMPVEEHGLYEWNVLEPSLDAIICPLRFNFAGDEVEGTLGGRLDPAVLAPGPTFYEQLGAPAVVFQPSWMGRSTYTRMATRGATLRAFDQLDAGVRAAAEALRGTEAHRYAFLYWDLIDRAGHEHGPSSPEFEAASHAALDALWSALGALGPLGPLGDGVTVLITADHGQVDVSPDRVDYLDELWPELPSLLSHPRPAGSSRDVFLHVKEGRVQTVIDELSVRLGDRATARPAAGLFSRIGPRLRARLGDVAVLSSPGREVWLRGAAAGEQWFRGQHGGMLAAETSTYLARVTR